MGTPAPTLTEFLLFPKLPHEIQAKIWEEFKEITTVIDTSRAKSQAAVPQTSNYTFLSRMQRHPLSSTCSTSRWVLENSKNCELTKTTYIQDSKPCHVFFHPESIFLYENMNDLLTFGMAVNSISPTDQLLKATSVKAIAIQNVLGKQLKTTAKLHSSFEYPGMWSNHVSLLKEYLALERLILIKPSWVENTTKGSLFKRNVNNRLQNIQDRLERYLKYNKETVTKAAQSLRQQHSQHLVLSSWWDDPEVEIMSQEEFDLLH